MNAVGTSDVLKQARRIVVKVGSSLVTNEGRGLDAEAINAWCVQLAALVKQGREVVMVSSGAIAEGMKRLGWATRPKELHELQAAAAVGQLARHGVRQAAHGRQCSALSYEAGRCVVSRLPLHDGRRREARDRRPLHGCERWPAKGQRQASCRVTSMQHE